MFADQNISDAGPDLLDFDFIVSLQTAVGPHAMRDLIAAFLRDCRTGAKRLADSGYRMGSPALGRDAHRFAGMLAQFGCPAAALAFRAASHSPAGDMPRLLAKAMDLIEPTCRAMEDLLAKEAA